MSAEAEESPLLEDRYQETRSGDYSRLRTQVSVLRAKIRDIVIVTYNYDL
jgi:hypothetical protein